MYKYRLAIHGLGINCSAKAINAKKMKFWSEKSTRELTEYLCDGDDEFEEFKVPNYAKFSGTYAEDEPNMGVELSCKSGIEIMLGDAIYGPLREKISKIELFRIHDDKEEKIVFPEMFEIPNLHNEEDEEDIYVSLGISQNNLVIIELEDGEWHYEWKSESPEIDFKDIFCISSNNAFGSDVDELIDDIIYAIFAGGVQSQMADGTETETKGMIAMLASS